MSNKTNNEIYIFNWLRFAAEGSRIAATTPSRNVVGNFRDTMKTLLTSFLFIVLTFFYSCTSKIQAFSLQRQLVRCDTCQYKNFRLEPGADKTISILNDSLLQYTVLLGHIGATTKIRYIREDNNLKVDTIDIYKRNKFQGYTNEIFGETIIYNRDSLIIPAFNEIYFVVKKKR